MAYRDDRGPRQYQRPYQPPVDVSSLNLKCAGDDCGVGIKSLPFNPRMNEDGTPSMPVYCGDCNAKRRQAFRR
jgi:hypothetical protein